ncbi:hypothetical protein K438DRAFT_1761156 [Mycena galopus ATCC 62051]|nr:hypothetical protein K438DRAFT_1761156 [Mycena galopus ATCC 62051]
MHRFLQIAEMQLEIVSHMHPVGDGRHLAALALTSRVWHDAALRELWSYQKDIINLIGCMPEDLWETVPGSTDGDWTLAAPRQRPTRPVVVSDWHRVLKYSRHVKTLVYFNCINRDLFYQSIRQTFPEELTKLCFETPGPDPSPSDWCNLVGALTHVQDLEVGVLNAKTFSLFGDLCRLEKLTATLSVSLSFVGAGSSCLPIRGICLDLAEDTSLTTLTDFVRTYKCPRLESFEVRLNLNLVPHEVQDFYIALAAHISPQAPRKLRVFNSHVPTATSSEQNGESLKPLFSFRRMRVLRISSPAGFRLNDPAIIEMALSWPRLRILAVTAKRQLRPADGTLLGLAALVHRCPDLEHLHISVNATVVPKRQPASGRSLTFLNMGHSQIPASDSHFFLCRWLATCFPILHRLTSSSGQYREIWEKVAEDRKYA